MNLNILARISLSAALLSTAGCLIGPRYKLPAPTPGFQGLPAGYKEDPSRPHVATRWEVARPSDAMLRGPWWKIYRDPELNALENSLQINNQNIKQYFENFMEARALVAEVNSELYPTLTANASYLRSFNGGGGGGGSRGSSGVTNSTETNSSGNSGSSGSARSSTVVSGGNSSTTSNIASGSASGASTGTSTGTSILAAASPITSIMTSLNLSWEPDLWGRVRNQLRAAQYNAQVSAADLENERLTEQASLAVYLFELRGQDALEELYQQTIEAYKKSLEFAKGQYETGITDQIAVVEATNTLQNAQATATNLGVLRAQYEHAIAVLVGRVPSTFSIPRRALTSTPPPVPLGFPSQLIERRPDVSSAERLMAAANANIGMAEAAYFPTVTLSAAGGFQSNMFNDLFDYNNRNWSIGPSVSETVFDAGLRTATVHQYVATYNADLAAYRQSVLTAFQQVEDYLAQVRILSVQLEQQRAAVRSGEQYVKLELGRYQTGIDPYVDVVTSQTTLLTDQQAAINVQIQEMTGSVQLIEALGGGWDRSQLPSPHDVSRWPKRSETMMQN